MKFGKSQYLLIVLTICFSGNAAAEESKSRLSDEPLTRSEDFFPSRSNLLIEAGDKFLGSGTLQKGFESFTGAVWQPTLLAYGTFRSALQTYSPGQDSTSEWVNRLDLNLNLYLTQTERLFASFRPLDKDGQYTGYTFHPDVEDEWQDHFDGNISTLFFEGDFGELFPKLDLYDKKKLDLGFSIGRQPISFQEGLLINDIIDSIGVTQNSIRPAGGSINNLRITGLYAWDEINRGDGGDSDIGDAQLVGLFSEADFYKSTVAVDLVAVLDNDNEGAGDSYHAGISSVQRIGHWNTAFRVLGSHADNPSSAADSGALLFTELSTTPKHTDDLLYVNLFYAIDEFTSASRDPEAGGPLGRTGILFASPQIGGAGATLSNQAQNAYGGAIGYQYFIGGLYIGKRNLVVELGGRTDTDNTDQSQFGVGARYQQLFGQHLIWQLDGSVADYESRDDNGYSLRTEIIYKF